MKTLSHTVLSKSIEENFSFLKSSTHIQDTFLRAIPIADLGFALPLAKFQLEDTQLCEQLAGLLGMDRAAAAAWIQTEYVQAHDAIFFLLSDSHGKTQGAFGLTGCQIESGVVILNCLLKSATCSAPLMCQALVSMAEWARKLTCIANFAIRIATKDTDKSAICASAGFIPSDTVPPTEDEVLLFCTPKQDVGHKMILTAGPSISAKEAVYAYDAASLGWNNNWAKYLTAFEKQFAEFVGVKYAMATSSCTGALQIALMALDIGPGDEVIVPDQTWVATANAVRYVGATPVFADIELDTWNIDVRSIEKLITKKTKAIMPVHMYGHPARMSGIVALAQKHGIPIVEDAAPAIGAEWRGKRCGSFGSFAAFSFQGAKLMVTGEGGMLVTDDDALYEKAFKIWDQGRNPSRAFWIDAHGVKFKMSNVQAAIGLAQLERVNELIEMKRRVFSWYQEGLEGVPGIHLNKEVEGARSIYWMSSLRLEESSPIGRDELMAQLKKRNVDTRPVFPAISQYPIWANRTAPQPTALRVGLQAMNLPSGVCLTKDEVMYVSKQVRSILTQ